MKKETKAEIRNLSKEELLKRLMELRKEKVYAEVEIRGGSVHRMITAEKRKNNLRRIKKAIAFCEMVYDGK